MSLQETEELVRANYTRIFKELTGQDAELGEADAKNLIIKSFSLVLYQVMQYVEAKGRAELLKTSTGDALDALAALFGITRQEARRAVHRALHAVRSAERADGHSGGHTGEDPGREILQHRGLRGSHGWRANRGRGRAGGGGRSRAAASPPERLTRWWTPSHTLRAWRASRRARADWTSRTTTA